VALVQSNTAKQIETIGYQVADSVKQPIDFEPSITNGTLGTAYENDASDNGDRRQTS
jgi:hypothetical protein